MTDQDTRIAAARALLDDAEARDIRGRWETLLATDSSQTDLTFHHSLTNQSL